jgi:hypothetical protein
LRHRRFRPVGPSLFHVSALCASIGYRGRKLMDIQRLLDGVMASHRQARSSYHLTLGGLRGALRDLPDDAPVTVEGGGSIGREGSYRGFYADLAFRPVEAATVAEVRAACERAATSEYEGYKGGEYLYGDETPLWIADYGCCGLAIIAAVPRDGGVHLFTKDTDE